MGIKANQISVENNKLIIGGTTAGVANVGQPHGVASSSQIAFTLDTGASTPGVKFTLNDFAISGASGSTTNSQIEAASVTTSDLALDAVDATIIADDAVGPDAISGADGLAASVTYDYTGVTAFSVPDPTQPKHAATKQYVDERAQGLDFKESVVASATTFLDAAYSSVSQEITLTNFGALVLDSAALSVGDRVLVLNGLSTDGGTTVDKLANGIYDVTTLGDSVTAAVLTRSSDFNSNADVTAGAYCLVTEGSTYQLSAFVLKANSGANGPLDPELDVDELNFHLFSGSATSVQGGSGISVTGTSVAVDLYTPSVTNESGLEFVSQQLAVNYDDATIELNGSQELGVKIGGSDPSLQIGTATGFEGLEVKYDNSTVGVGADGLLSSVLQKEMEAYPVSQVTLTNTGFTGITIDSTNGKTPAKDCAVLIFANGILSSVGDGNYVGVDFFFMPAGSDAAGASFSDVMDLNDIGPGDELYFQPSNSGWHFDSNSDDIKIVFQSL